MKNAKCVTCSKPFSYSEHQNVGKYCGQACYRLDKSKQAVLAQTKKYAAWLAGKSKLSKSLTKKYLAEKFGYCCSVCKITEWNKKPIVLELEHKDGNSENNVPANLCLICPNCHSQTPTFKGKNKGNGRFARREKYRAGLSY